MGENICWNTNQRNVFIYVLTFCLNKGRFRCSVDAQWLQSLFSFSWISFRRGKELALVTKNALHTRLFMMALVMSWFTWQIIWTNFIGQLPTSKEHEHHLRTPNYLHSCSKSRLNFLKVGGKFQCKSNFIFFFAFYFLLDYTLSNKHVSAGERCKKDEGARHRTTVTWCLLLQTQCQ